jgi:hypothetical protein
MIDKGRHVRLPDHRLAAATAVLALLVIPSIDAITTVQAAEDASIAMLPDVVRAREFSWPALAAPEPIFWPAYMWMWNGTLDEDVLRRQLADMAAHDARNVCVIPMPHEFRPDTTNNRLDPPYLSPKFFDRVRTAVDEAERLDMHYWLYDEGGWPSGQATGRILEARADLVARVLRRDSSGSWTEATRPGFTDLLNPETTSTFINLTHERYRAAVGRHFGSTIRLVFTDEPAVSNVAPGVQIPWTAHAAKAFRERFGYDLHTAIAAFDQQPTAEMSQRDQQTRVDFFDFWSDRFRVSYFEALRNWCREQHLAHGGHLGGDDETDGCVRYGFGHIMRQLGAMDVPGVDIIWRQVFPGQKNHHFAKYAAAAAHQTGSHLALTESFCVYGNGLTPAQMKWLVDYQYVRGLNLLVAGCYPLSTQDHLMPGERPHFGPVDPLWDLLPDFHRYVARLGYVLACGEPSVDVALYYPVRDMWALGRQSPAVAAHEALAAALLARQSDFDIVDDDTLANSKIATDGAITVGPMRYRTILLGPTEWISAAARRRLEEFVAAGGRIIRGDEAGDVRACLTAVPQSVAFAPAVDHVRACLRRWNGGGAAFFFNEGQTEYSGHVTVPFSGDIAEVLPATPAVRQIADMVRGAKETTMPIRLLPGQSMLLVVAERSSAGQSAAEDQVPGHPPNDQSLVLGEGWEARVLKEHRVGEHDYEVLPGNDPFRPVALGSWESWLGPDFSGRAIYRRRVELPDSWQGQSLLLDLGRVDFAARAAVNGKPIGDSLWEPRQIVFTPPRAATSFELSIEVANTLANALTAPKVQRAWQAKRGPGWPGPYHERALKFELDSRSGGLFGPVTLHTITH